MRLSLLAFAVFAFTLVGCADDFVGPDAPLTGSEAASSFAPEAPEPASPLFSTWIASDDDATFYITFAPSTSANSPAGPESDSDARFEGTFSYRSASDISSAPIGRIIGGSSTDGALSFTVVDGSEIMAQATGVVSDKFETIALKVQLADGSVRDLYFKEAESQVSA